MITLAAILCPLALPLPPQEPREPVPLASIQSAVYDGAQLVTTDDRVASTWKPKDSDSIFFSQSDGRGVTWSPQVEFDVTPGAAKLSGHYLAAVEDTAWVAWNDSRFAPSANPWDPIQAPFLRAIDLTTGSIGPELALPVQGSLPLSETKVKALSAVRVAGEVHVHALLYSRDLSANSRSLILASSHDGGQTFPFVHVIGSGLVFSEYEMELVVDGQTVHLVFPGNWNSNELRYQRSTDGGVSLDFSPTQVLFDSPNAGIATLVAAGTDGNLAVSWTDQETLSSEPFDLLSRVLAIVSKDGGSSFSNVSILDSIASPYMRMYAEQAFVEPASGVAMATWLKVNIDTDYKFFWWRATQDGGLSWMPTALLANGEGTSKSALVGDTTGRGRVFAIHSFDSTGAWANTMDTLVSVSHDGGLTFEPNIDLVPSGSAAITAVFNERYQNVVTVQKTTTHSELLSGGVRPQTVDVQGFSAGPAAINVSFSHFDDGNDLVWLMASGTQGDLLLPNGDNRNLGLGITPLLLQTLSNQAIYLMPLDGSGAASLGPLNVQLPPGMTLFLSAFTIDFTALEFGDISDLKTIHS